MVTIVDVAKLANVSVATVSRVLNSDFMVSPEKKERVLNAIEKLDYKPNRQTKVPENKVVICVVSVFIEEFLFSLRQAALDEGYTLTVYICTNKENENDLSIFMKSFSKKQLAGVLFFGYNPETASLLENLESVPTVFLYDTVGTQKQYCSVSFNEYQMAYDLTTSLLDQGCHSPLLICPIATNENLFPYSTKIRIRGFRDALEDRGLSYSKNNVIEKDVTIESGTQLAKELNHLPGHPDALLFMCTPTLIGYYYESTHLADPEYRNIPLAAFDTDEIIDSLHLNVTRVIPPFSALGQEAIRTLHDMIKNEQTDRKKIYLNHTILP